MMKKNLKKKNNNKTKKIKKKKDQEKQVLIKLHPIFSPGVKSSEFLRSTPYHPESYKTLHVNPLYAISADEVAVIVSS